MYQKAILLFVLMTVSALAHATSIQLPTQNLASARFDVTIPALKVRSFGVDFTRDGDLVVKVERLMGRGRPVTYYQPLVKRLSKSEVKELFRLVKGLSYARLSKIDRPAVCHIQPGPGMRFPISEDLKVASRYLRQHDMFVGGQHIVLSDDQCWKPAKIRPTSNYRLRQAEFLKSVLRALATELIATSKLESADTPIKICPAVYKPVCGLPIPKKCFGEFCPNFVAPVPVTFSNMCRLEAAQASFLYVGRCK